MYGVTHSLAKMYGLNTPMPITDISNNDKDGDLLVNIGKEHWTITMFIFFNGWTVSLYGQLLTLDPFTPAGLSASSNSPFMAGHCRWGAPKRVAFGVQQREGAPHPSILQELYWLPVSFHTQLKILVLTYKALYKHGLGI